MAKRKIWVSHEELLTARKKYAEGTSSVKLDDTYSSRKVFGLEEFKTLVPEYQFQGYLNSGKDGLYKDVDKTKFPVLVETFKDGSTVYRPYTQETAEGNFANYKDILETPAVPKSTPVRGYAGGGTVGNDQVSQLILAYCQATGSDPKQVIMQLKKMKPEQQKATVQQMAQQLQEAATQQQAAPEMMPEQEQQMMMAFGGILGGEEGMEGGMEGGAKGPNLLGASMGYMKTSFAGLMDQFASTTAGKGLARITPEDSYRPTSLNSNQIMATGGVAQQVPVNLEHGEVYDTGDSIKRVQGKTHENGGENRAVPEGTKVFSERISIDGKTMAQRKVDRERNLKRIAKVFDKNPGDFINQNTLKRTLAKTKMQEAADLAVQETAKQVMTPPQERPGAIPGGNPMQDAAMEGQEEPVQSFAGGTGLLGVGSFLKEKKSSINPSGFVSKKPFVAPETIEERAKRLSSGEPTPDFSWSLPDYSWKKPGQDYIPFELPKYDWKKPGRDYIPFELQIPGAKVNTYPNMPTPIGVNKNTVKKMKNNGISVPVPPAHKMQYPADIEDAPKLIDINDILHGNAQYAPQNPADIDLGYHEDEDYASDGNLWTGEEDMDTDAAMGYTKGDKVGMVGTGLGTAGPTLMTLLNRAGDKPHENMFANYGTDSKKSIKSAMANLGSLKDSMMDDITLGENAAFEKNRNTTRSLNTNRALDLAAFMGGQKARRDVRADYAKQMLDAFNLDAQIGLDVDNKRATGRAMQDKGNRMDRDNFFTQFSTNLADMGKSLQETGKNMNTKTTDQNFLDMMKDLNKYGLEAAYSKDGKYLGFKKAKGQ